MSIVDLEWHVEKKCIGKLGEALDQNNYYIFDINISEYLFGPGNRATISIWKGQI